MIIFSLFLSFSIKAQQATSITSGVTFQWAATPQQNNADPVVISSITVNSLLYDYLIVPSGYALTQLGPGGHTENKIILNGTTVINNSTNTTNWNTAALAAFQSFNLNHYFLANPNGVNFCGVNGGNATTLAQKQTLSYNPGIVSTEGAIVAVTERNANNCFYIELYGTPAGGGADTILGGTFVRANASGKTGGNYAPPATGVDYWESGRRNDNNGTIGIALFYLSEIAPLNSIVKSVTLTGASSDHGDGKFFIASRLSALSVNKVVDLQYPNVGDTITYTITASNGTGPGIYEDTLVNVADFFPSGVQFTGSTATQGSFDPATGDWTVGALLPGQTETLIMRGVVLSSGSYSNSVYISGTLYNSTSGSNGATAEFTPIVTDPDYNSGFADSVISGSISTNDQIPTGVTVTYGAPLANSNNPTNDVPFINTATGEYVFTGTDPGVYTFEVEVCQAGQTTNCPTEVLVITVVDPYSNQNTPVTNIDQSSVAYGSTSGVEINITANDQPGNANGSLGTPTLGNKMPSNGTVSIDPMTGMATYIPDPTFIGVDTFSYTVCDTTTTPELCDTTIVIVDVNGPGANGLTASDDQSFTTEGTPVTDSVLTNDVDPNGDPMTVTAVTTATATPDGNGTYTIDANGEYTYTPNPGFIGSTNFVYEVCDGEGNCEEATVYIIVAPKQQELNPDINVGLTNINITGDISTNDENVPAGSTYDGSNITADPTNPDSAVPVISADGTYTFNTAVAGEYNFLVPVCPPGVTTNCPEELLTITVVDPSTTSTDKDPPVGNNDLAATPQNTPVDINVRANDAEGEIDHGLSAPSVTSAPSNGTATVNADGTIKYTPNNGFTGTDTFEYQICDSFASPIKCDTAQVIVTVPESGDNIIEASDDFAHIEQGGYISSNALANDYDPEATNLTVSNPTTTPVTIPGVGTYTLAADGTYTFQGLSGWTGSTNIVYEVCDADGVCTEATIYIVATPPNVAGLNLIDFSLTSQDCNTLLSWTTSNEANTDFAMVQRSDDGRNFTTLATVELSGNTTQPTTYSYTDLSLESGTYFYRLQFMDLDGSTEFTDMVALSTSCTTSDNSRVTIYPNPGPGAYHVNFRGYIEDSYILSVYSVIGQKVYERTIEISSSAQNEELDLSAFSSGPYMLKITNGRDFVETIMLIKD